MSYCSPRGNRFFPTGSPSSLPKTTDFRWWPFVTTASTPLRAAPLSGSSTTACAFAGPGGFWPAAPACSLPAGPCQRLTPPYFPSPAGSFTHPISSHPRSIPRLRASGTLAIWGWDAGGSWLPSGGLCALWRFPGSPWWRSTPKRKTPIFCPISPGKTASGFAAASPAAT